VAVASVEVRFPLVGIFTGELEYGPVPIEGLLFGDAGVAWGQVDEPSFFGGERDIVKSVGAGVRVNALGFAILEIAGARPLDRPGKGWVFSFNLRPGF
jgi:outer membrane protein assembly factor BamA